MSEIVSDPGVVLKTSQVRTPADFNYSSDSLM